MSKTSTLHAIKSHKQVDPLRAALKDSIASADAAGAVLVAHRSAIGRAKQMVSEAEAKLEGARAAVADARDAHARRIADAATTGGAPVAASAMRASRSVQTDAEDDLVAAQDALAKLEVADLAELEAAKTAAENDVGRCVNLLLADEARRMIDEAAKLKNDLFEKILVLRFLSHDDGAIVAEGPAAPGAFVARMKQAEARTRPLDELRDSIDRVAMNLIISRKIHDPAVEPWIRVRQALRSDPDAPLPLMAGNETHERARR